MLYNVAEYRELLVFEFVGVVVDGAAEDGLPRLKCPSFRSLEPRGPSLEPCLSMTIINNKPS